MAKDPNNVIKTWFYTDDNGVNWGLRVSVATASAAGFVSPGNTVLNPWGKISRKNRPRRIDGVNVDGSGQRHTLYLPNLSNYNTKKSNGVFTFKAAVYKIVGWQGEDRSPGLNG